ncbi:MAG: hypothetical protein JO257_08925, partial [Deltaproteobacteria bacterium]|nr:hypothetical protein [Deltaproteobacteria bacterium]
KLMGGTHSSLPGPVGQYIVRIAAQPDFPTAIRVIHTAAASLTSSQNALCVLFAGGVAAAAPDGGPARKLDPEVRSLVERVATTGQRILLGRIAIEPVCPGAESESRRLHHRAAPSRAVLIVHRPPTSAAYSFGELATLSAFAAQLHPVFPKLLAL